MSILNAKKNYSISFSSAEAQNIFFDLNENTNRKKYFSLFRCSHVRSKPVLQEQKDLKFDWIITQDFILF